MPKEVYKKIGQTPLELLNDIKSKNKDIKKISFAGRLDPMAHGTMIVLINDECKLQEKYIGLSKTYEFEILFGFKTDTYDILGILESFIQPNISLIDLLDISNNIKTFNQPYPPYSSIVVNKKPLWKWSKLGLIDTIQIPEKTVSIFSLEEIASIRDISDSNKLFNEIKYMIYSLSKENQPKFRVNEIIDEWTRFFKIHTNFKPIIKKYRAKVSSGTYIRSLCNQIGNDLECGALALSIHRVNIY